MECHAPAAYLFSSLSFSPALSYVAALHLKTGLGFHVEATLDEAPRIIGLRKAALQSHFNTALDQVNVPWLRPSDLCASYVQVCKSFKLAQSLLCHIIEPLLSRH